MTTQKYNNCKSCTENVRINNVITQQDIDKAIDGIARIKRIKLADDTTYQTRLSKCSTCEYLQSGTTCLQCGCIVHIRAKVANTKCPLSRNRKW